MARTRMPLPTLRRVPRYLRLSEELLKQGIMHVSSAELAERLGSTSSQVRQDFAALKEVYGISAAGQQGYGYRVDSLLRNMEKILSLSLEKSCVWIGIGNLALALAHNLDFSRCGIRPVAAFDILPGKVGTHLATRTGTIPILHVDTLAAYCARHHPLAAILTCPPQDAQELADTLAACGVQGIWNLTNVDILVPAGVALENLHLADSLMTLACRIPIPESPSALSPNPASDI